MYNHIEKDDVFNGKEKRCYTDFHPCLFIIVTWTTKQKSTFSRYKSIMNVLVTFISLK